MTVTFTDTPEITGEGSIRKVDADDPTKGLAGAVIEIIGVDNDFTGTYVTGTGGYLTDVPWKDMPIGSYTATEVTPPEGYTKSLEANKVKQSFHWDGKTDVALVFENDAKVKVRLIKKDDSDNPLPGAVFNIVKDGQIIGTEETKADGSITVTDLMDGVYPLSRKMCCGICGFTLYRHVTRKGSATWSCGRHQRKASNCATGPIPEEAIYAAFLRMYNKLRLHEGVILRPALSQMDSLETALQRGNPAMLEVNQAIAQATERGYKISKLRANGLLDADACAAQMAVNNAQLTQLRAKRRRLLKNDDIGEAAEALRQTADTIRPGPERLEKFDEALFAELVEQIVASPTALRFRLYGGIEVTEQIGEDER